MIYDVAVIGLGAHGSAAVDHLAGRGLRVLGLEQFAPGHERGASHGVHRLFRLAYAEGAQYTPLLARAATLWQELEQRSGERLFIRNGVLSAAPAGGSDVTRAIASARAQGIAVEELDAAQIMARWPAFDLPADYVGVFQAESGFVMSERANAAHLISAAERGAHLLAHAPMIAWQPRADGVEIETSKGRFQARQMVVTVGAWVGRLDPILAAVSRVERRVLGFFPADDPSLFRPDRCPGYTIQGEVGIYGFPIFGAPGVKIGVEGHLHEVGTPETLEAGTTPADAAVLERGLRYLRGVHGPALRLSRCLITLTPDEHFIIDHLPDAAQVHVISACSGHGYKMASVIGEIIADRVEGREDRFDLSSFRLGRFAAQ